MQELFDLSGKQALVTGGAQGLGRMIAEGLLSAGAAVAITSRKAEVAQASAAEMAALGQCTAYAADLSTPAAAVDLVRRFADDTGQCDILVNNAGKTWGGPIETFPDKAWPDVMAVNVQTPFTMVRELLPLLRAGAKPDDPARIINIGSVAGAKVERIGAYSYSSSKAAIHMLTRDLAAELAASHITVNAVIPGYFPTKMTSHLRDGDDVDPAMLARIPLGRLGRPSDIAALIVFLASTGGSYVTGSEIAVDGGLLGCG
ncbi:MULTISPECIES: SDR family oxidoreductase [Sphingobium]|uniref:SDR family oxidoreductase n=1 Tax=Sphingobium sp. MI1205 TaxID=407020 RepID=UPI00077053A4|nr:SDR family oxidoreductase [Sphingobium sp. MI1205]AMK19575.1 short-chain dehydrogenase/reductase SDR [Sphingobium sp. MI1205]